MPLEKHRIILASASPRRRELLAGMGYEFEVIPADVQELQDTDGITPEQLALANARLKAEALAKIHPDALVIGADTVVECGGVCCGKPADEADAVRMLQFLSGKEHHVITGVALRIAGKKYDFADTSTVVFKDLSEADIHAYMKSVNVMDKAGAYAIQEHAEIIINRFDGSLSNIIGLPVERLSEVLQSF